MNKKPKWVIFDVGQVLYDYTSFELEVSKYLNIDYSILKIEMNEIVENSMTGELTFEQVWIGVLSKIKRENELTKIIEFFWDPKKFSKDTKLLLKQLHKKGYSIALFTNNWPNMREWMIKNLDEKNMMIKHIFESAKEHLRKPDEKFYKLVEERIAARADEIYFIDDLEINIVTGQRMNWQTFHYSFGNDGGRASNERIRKELL